MPDGPPQPKSPIDIAEQLANINETNATAQHKRASADALDHKALMSPLQLLADHAQRNADRSVSDFHSSVDHLHKNQDRMMEDFHRSKDREAQKQQRANQVV
jgi:hypothetical protein